MSVSIESNKDYALGMTPGSRWFARVMAFGEHGRVQVLPINKDGREVGHPFWTVASLITGTLDEELQFIRGRNERLAEPTRTERIGAAFRGIRSVQRGVDLGDLIDGMLSGGRQNVLLTKQELTGVANRISQLSRGIGLAD